MIDYAAVLQAMRPGAAWSLSGNLFETLVWHSESEPPTQAECDAAWPQVQYDREYARVRAARAARYTAETDPMYWKVMRAEDGLSLQDWVDAVEQIRVDLPYPEPV